ASLGDALVGERLGMPGLPSVVSRAWSAWCLAELGEFAASQAIADEAVRIAEAAGQPYSLTIAYLGAALPRLRKGELSGATVLLERGLRVAEDAEILLLAPQLAAPLGHAYTVVGRFVEAIPLLEQTPERDVTSGVMSYHALTLTYLA